MEDEVIKMEVVNPHAAGIDVGSRSHWVAVGQKEEDKKYNGVGIASFICGLVGIFYYPFPCGLAALITGIIGIIKFDPNKEKGKWMSITGVVLGALEILWSILILLLGLGIFITALGTM